LQEGQRGKRKRKESGENPGNSAGRKLFFEFRQRGKEKRRKKRKGGGRSKFSSSHVGGGREKGDPTYI